MARIIQIIELGPEGLQVRLDDGSYTTLGPDAGGYPSLGDEIPSEVPDRIGRPTQPSPRASPVPSGFEKRLMKEYEDRLPLLSSKEIEGLQLHGVERARQLANKIEVAEKQLRNRAEELTRIRGKIARKTARLATHQEALKVRSEVRFAAAIIAADTVREFADGLLLTQRQLAVHAALLRDYTSGLIREVRVRIDASELFAAEVPIPWSDDPIAQSSIRTCEEIIGANKKIESIDVPGQYDQALGLPKAWSPIVLEWEAVKVPAKEPFKNPERISEFDLRSILAKQSGTKPDEVTEDQIKRAALEFCHHYETFQMIPAAWTDLPLPNYRALRAFARPDSAFWKERQKEFLEHNNGENVLLGAWWLSGDRCTFYAGGDMKSPSEEVLLVFKALAREAGKGLDSARGSEAWIDWLELLSCAEDESTGELRYKVSLGSSYVDDSRSKRALSEDEEIPQNALVEYRLMQNGSLRQGKRWYTRSPRLDNLFARSANQCLELWSLVPSAPTKSDTTENNTSSPRPAVARDATEIGNPVELGSESPPKAKNQRGRPPIVDDEKKKAACEIRVRGGSLRDAAKLIYDKRNPTQQEVRNTSTILRHYRQKLKRSQEPSKNTG